MATGRSCRSWTSVTAGPSTGSVGGSGVAAVAATPDAISRVDRVDVAGRRGQAHRAGLADRDLLHLDTSSRVPRTTVPGRSNSAPKCSQSGPNTDDDVPGQLHFGVDLSQRVEVAGAWNCGCPGA